MRFKFLIYLLIISTTSCLEKQQNELKIALCEKQNGCKIISVSKSKSEIALMIKKPKDFFGTNEKSILVIENCEFKLEEKLTLQQIHNSYGGKNEPNKLSKFDLDNYLKKYNCFSCPNPTKKFSFNITTPEYSGSSFYYISWDKKESYMPNEAYQLLYKDQEGIAELKMDVFLRNGEAINYSSHPSYGKIISKTATGVGNLSLNNKDGLNEKWFKENFKPTGNKRKHLNSSVLENEYKGSDLEGNSLIFWLGPANDFCLPYGKFEALGVYFVGYIAFDGLTYALTEVSGPNYKIQVTAIENENYNFDATGYSYKK